MNHQPIKFYATLEFWENADSSVGYRLSNNNSGTLDMESVSRVMREVSQDINAQKEGSPVAVAIMIHENGYSHLDYQRERDFSDKLNYIYTREHFNRAMKILASRGKRRGPNRSLRWVWSLEWFLRKITGRLNSRQNTPAPGSSTAPPTVNEALDEASRGSVEQSGKGGGNVVQLYPKTQDT